MRLVLARIDDRLIHGQVTVGWGQRLQPDRILLASDEVADDPWQTRVYTSTTAPGVAVSVLGLNDAAAILQGGAEAAHRSERVILLTGSAADMHTLVSLGVSLARINIGGMHFSAGKQQLLPAVYVDRDDLAVFRALLRRGIRLAAQTVPGAREIVVDDALLAAMEARL
jgi:mannose/fructose/N-acetylgalactosamine-specific phosphotransferase system component IIB